MNEKEQKLEEFERTGRRRKKEVAFKSNLGSIKRRAQVFSFGLKYKKMNGLEIVAILFDVVVAVVVVVVGGADAADVVV